jgi:hypothetical protein
MQSKLFVVFINAEETAKWYTDNLIRSQAMKIEMLEKVLPELLSKVATLDKKADDIVKRFNLMTAALTAKEKEPAETKSSMGQEQSK